MEFKKYLHIERLSNAAVDGILNGHVYVTPKLDGTNSCFWFDDDTLTFRCGARTREVGVDDDNANFARFVNESMDDYMIEMRAIATQHPNLVFYGEWLGGVSFDGTSRMKFVGSIKDYVEGGFFLFDVFDSDTLSYVSRSDSLWGEFTHGHVVPVLAELDNPSEEELAAIVESNHFNLPPNVVGEGIVIKNYDYHDVYGNFQEAKIVRAEYKEKKSRPKVVYTASDVIAEFCDRYLTSAFLDKCRNKVCQMCGADEFDTTNKKMMGMMMSLYFNDLLSENVCDFVKRRKNATVDFGALRSEANRRTRVFLGLE